MARLPSIYLLLGLLAGELYICMNWHLEILLISLEVIDVLGVSQMGAGHIETCAG